MPVAVPPVCVIVLPSFGKKSSLPNILIVVALPGEALAVSFVAVGVVGFGSVLSGFPSPSESGFDGFVPPVISSPFVKPSPSQSNADHVA